MYTKALKAQVEHDMYVVDAQLVAEALLRRAAARRPARHSPDGVLVAAQRLLASPRPQA